MRRRGGNLFVYLFDTDDDASVTVAHPAQRWEVPDRSCAGDRDRELSFGTFAARAAGALSELVIDRTGVPPEVDLFAAIRDRATRHSLVKWLREVERVRGPRWRAIATAGLPFSAVLVDRLMKCALSWCALRPGMVGERAVLWLPPAGIARIPLLAGAEPIPIAFGGFVRGGAAGELQVEEVDQMGRSVRAARLRPTAVR